jgi:YbbR domain-containing protein
MKIVNKFFMATLILSVFFGCKKDDDNLPLTGIVGTYNGTITITELNNQEIANVPITVSIPTDNPGNTITLTIPEGKITVMPAEINAPCTVTSDSNKYSFSGTTSIPISETEAIPITIENSSITKAGKADIKIIATVSATMLPEGSVPEGVQVLPLHITFDGQKN